ncbi:hypothetical protein NDU88_003270 [Pleurodeles waltl]|uniref:Secreted protein n=1 Tax=Pleurodeles waltl TaxID=8319 RepID=A0AAV7MR61_PLEWA|nr:hypothetical protein NDU88_003270 [Pleurodeles waltl]
MNRKCRYREPLLYFLAVAELTGLLAVRNLVPVLKLLFMLRHGTTVEAWPKTQRRRGCLFTLLLPGLGCNTHGPPFSLQKTENPN